MSLISCPQIVHCIESTDPLRKGERGGLLHTEAQLLTLYIPFHEKGAPFSTPSIDKWYPFHIPCLELCIPFIAVNALESGGVVNLVVCLS